MNRVFAASLIMFSQSCFAQNLTPQQAVKRMKLPKGLTANVAVSEPIIRQPVCIEFDDKGRLWVIQYLQYPNPNGLKRKTVDRYSRTQYDRVPKPPPFGPKGEDRITILEDVDQDGDFELVKDFVSGLNLTTGIAFGNGGVYVLNVPYLLFYPDRNRDDIPDRDPDVLLTGFGMEDAHSVANSLTWGPDGWLYGCQGSTVTASIRGIEFQQGVWRYHHQTDRFELFCEGGGNSWGIDFDEQGQLLYSTNWGGNVMLHGVQGAYLLKSFGKHGELHNPYAFGYFGHVPHKNFKGGHVSVGGIFYRGLTFPKPFYGKYVAADLLGHGAYWHTVERDGSTFRSRYAGTLIDGRDPWFAPTDVTLGPDGAVYVTDWHDQRTAHPDPDAVWDKSNGRVYRIQAAGATKNERVDLQLLSNAKLLDLIYSKDHFVSSRARRILGERSDPRVNLRLLKELQHPDETRSLRALWTLAASQALNSIRVEGPLNHKSSAVRSWMVRLIGDEPELHGHADMLVQLASRDPSIDVRSQLACTARRVPDEKGLEIAKRLIERKLDRQDRYLPLLLWWATEQHATSNLEATRRLFADANIWQSQLFDETVAPRLIRRLSAERSDRALSVAHAVIKTAPAKRQSELVEELSNGLQLAKHAKSISKATQQMLVVLSRTAPRVTQHRLAMQLNLQDAESRLLEALKSSSAKADRAGLLVVLAQMGSSACVEPLLGMMGNFSHSEQKQAYSVLARFEHKEVTQHILKVYQELPASMRGHIRSSAFGRKKRAAALIELIATNPEWVKEVGLSELSTITLHGDPSLNKRLESIWGRVSARSPGEKLAEVRRLNNDLRAASGDLTRGKKLFAEKCANCHKLHGEGKSLGPDLTHANRKDRNFLLVSLVDPSHQIRKEYLQHVVRTVDGRVLSGLVTTSTDESVTLTDPKQRATVISRNQIDSLRVSPTSFMPENLYREFSPQQLRDLFRYLQN